jgi:hypothetical protein
MSALLMATKKAARLLPGAKILGVDRFIFWTGKLWKLRIYFSNAHLRDISCTQMSYRFDTGFHFPLAGASGGGADGGGAGGGGAGGGGEVGETSI